jgi:hypothetical protein
MLVTLNIFSEYFTDASLVMYIYYIVLLNLRIRYMAIVLR